MDPCGGGHAVYAVLEREVLNQIRNSNGKGRLDCSSTMLGGHNQSRDQAEGKGRIKPLIAIIEP